MREKPLVQQVDVVIGEKDDERVITVPKATADRWPDVYRPATTAAGNPTAAAKRATENTEGASDPDAEFVKKPRRSRAKSASDSGPKSIDELPTAPTTSPAPAVADTTAGDAGVTTEGVTS